MIKTHLGTLDDEALTSAFASVYEDYVVPMHFSVEALRLHVTTGSGLLTESPLWLDEHGETVGLGLLGVRGKRGWVGGFGITKPHRGLGLSLPLAEEMLERSRRLGLDQVQLEVIAFNPYAIRTYERCGFETRRDLHLFACGPDVAAAAGPDPGFLERDWRSLLNGAVPTVAPCWQRETEAFKHGNALVGLVHPDSSDTYAVVAGMPEIANIVALNAPDAASVANVTAAVAARFPGLGLRILNEPSDSPLCPWLLAAGYEEKLRQHEMVAPLSV